MLASAFIRWIPLLPKLRSVKVFSGPTLNDDRLPDLIRSNCPKFESLSIYLWYVSCSYCAYYLFFFRGSNSNGRMNPECDQKLASLFSALPPNRLRSFHTFSRTQFGPQACFALNNHGASLKVLQLELEQEVVPQLGALKGCTALEILTLSDSSKSTDLKSNANDALPEITAWLVSCQNLHTLTIHGFMSAAALVTPVLLSDKIRLEELEINNYMASDQDSFHRALLNQTKLQRLLLDGDQVETRDSLDIFVHSLCQLKELRSLKLVYVSANFNDRHINAITEQLEYLEHLYVGGSLSDISLESISYLKNLRSVSFSGITTFTMDGFLELIQRLGPGNKGLLLTVDNASADDGLSEEEQAFVRNTIVEAVDGRFEYIFVRGTLHSYPF